METLRLIVQVIIGLATIAALLSVIFYDLKSFYTDDLKEEDLPEPEEQQDQDFVKNL